MKRVFVSYVRENSAIVDRLVAELAKHGIDPWLDRNAIEPGERWQDAIRRGIQGGDYFLACFSKESHARIKSYMNEELTLAVEQLRLRPTTRSWFIPVLLTASEIPDRGIGGGETLRNLQHVDLSVDWAGGIGRIAKLINPVTMEPSVTDLLHSYRGVSPTRVWRWLPEQLNDPDVRDRIRSKGLYERDEHPQGGAESQLVAAEQLEASVLLDIAAGIIWQRDPPWSLLAHAQAQEYVRGLNRSSYAGLTCWRLPTIEEGLGIMGSKGRVDPRFSGPKQIWTCDTAAHGEFWAVDHASGIVGRLSSEGPLFGLSVRAVAIWSEDHPGWQAR